MPCPYQTNPQYQDRCDEGSGTPRTGACRSVGTEHAQDLLDLRCQLGGITQASRPVPRRAQPVAQTLHVIRDRTVHARGPQRLRESIPVACECVRYVAREHGQELLLQATQPRQLRAISPRWFRRGGPPPPPARQPGNQWRHEHHGEPSLPTCLAAEAVDVALTATRQERRQRSGRAWLRTGRDGEPARKRGRRFVLTGARVEVGIADFRQHEISGRIGHREKPERLAAGDSAALSSDSDLSLRRIDAETRWPFQRRLRPQGDIPNPIDRHRRLDRLADTRRRGIDMQIERERLPYDIRTSWSGCGRQRQHGDCNGIAAQRVALFAAEERERDR